MAGLIRKSADRIDWHIVIERATRWGGQKCVYLMSLLVRELMGAAPPDTIMSEIRPEDYQSVFLDDALEQIFDPSPSGDLIKRLRVFSRTTRVKGIKGKFLALLRKAFPSKKDLARIYPVLISSPKIYLCYLFHLGQLIVYFTVILRLFCRDQSVIKPAHKVRRMRAISDWMFS
jgi:hypothetical protein